MKVLLLASCYPPQPIVGAFRIEKLARAFATRGHEVFVVAPDAGGSGPQIEHVSETRVPLRKSPKELVLSLRNKLARHNGQPENHEARRPDRPADSEGQRSWLAGLAVGLLNLPDMEQGVIPTLLSGVDQIRRHGPFDLLYSSAPCFSTQLAGYIASRRLDIPWVAEYRDPWRSNGSMRFPQMHPWTDRLDAWMEQRCVRAADLVVAVTKSAGEQFRNIRGDQNVVVSLNGIGNLRTERVPRERRDRLKLVYAGSLYHPRDPRPLLHAIAKVSQEQRLPVPEFIFAGDCEEFDGQRLDEFAQTIGIGDSFRLMPWVPQAEARALVETADLLLLPAQGWTNQLPNKLFDYLASRVPILSFAEPDSETAGMLRRVSGHFLCTDLRELEEVVRQALLGASSLRPVGDLDFLQSLTVERQFTHLINHVEFHIGQHAVGGVGNRETPK